MSYTHDPTCSACGTHILTHCKFTCDHHLDRFEKWLEKQPFDMTDHSKQVEDWHSELRLEGYKRKMIVSYGWEQIGKWNACLVTVNPNEIEDPTLLYNYWQKLISYKMFEADLSAIMTIEQRSETSEWQGYHTHIVLIRNVKSHNTNPSMIRQTFQKVYGDLVGTTKHINVIYANDPKNFIKYVLGQKKQEKLEKVQQDNAMRVYYKLQNVYTSQLVSDCLKPYLEICGSTSDDREDVNLL